MKNMSIAAFYSGIFASILAVASSSSCLRSITCPCGSSSQSYTHCLNNTSNETYTCEIWSQCETCEANRTYCVTCPTERYGPTCTEVTQELIGRKSQYTYGTCPYLQNPIAGSTKCTHKGNYRTCTGTCLPGYHFENEEDADSITLECHGWGWKPRSYFPPCKSGGDCALKITGPGFYNCTTNAHGTLCDITCNGIKTDRYYCYPPRQWNPQLPPCAIPKYDDKIGRSTRAASCLCKNGGTCIERGRCSCPVGTTGSLCQIQSENTGRECGLRITGDAVYNCTVRAEETFCDITCDDIPRGRYRCHSEIWAPQLPYCTAPKDPIANCLDPGSIAYGYRRYMNGSVPRVYSYGQSYQYYCNNGYDLEGSNVLVCLTSGQWSSNKPSCQRTLDIKTAPSVYCSDPGSIQFGSYRSNTDNSAIYQRYAVGKSVNYYCQYGYDLVGNRIVTCLPSGSWTRKPLCRRSRMTPKPYNPIDNLATCPDPGAIAFGYRRLVNGAAYMSSRIYTNGQSFHYFCNQGYELIGNNRLTCLPSGQWSSNTPRCQRTVKGISGPYCPFPEIDVTGMIIEPFLDTNDREQIFRPGTEMKFDCEEGYEIEGKVWIIYCKLDGEWTSKPPTCKRDPAYKAPPLVFCNYPGADENGIIEDDNDAKVVGQTQAYVPGAELRYLCKDGYEVVGTSNLVCTLEGEWSADPPICRKLITTAKPPAELRIVCPNPIADPNGAIEYNPPNDPRGQGYEAGSQVNFKCKNGYELDGPTYIICLRNTRWTNNPPTCRVRSRTFDSVTCTDPGSIENSGLTVYHGNPNAHNLPSAEVHNSLVYPIGTRLGYVCNSGYLLVGAEFLSCESNGRWSEETPRCVEDCGVSPLRAGGKVTYGTNTTAGEFPWMVFLYMNETGDTCGGVLLDHRTVLSAAHCFQGAEYCTLYFGKYNRSDENDDQEVVTRTSTEIISHSEFSFNTFDNDIAIVRFSPAVQYNERIRPICMPTPDSTDMNIVPGQKGYLAGWGRDERQMPTSRLMLGNLPVQESETCTLAYRSRNEPINITPGMFCAGFSDRLINACRGDSGSPLVFYNNDTERFVVEGLVSHGTSGRCDQVERYTMFTKVSSYLDWILRYWRPETR